ncbi:elongation factor P [Candidatus Woesebacteria bacterium RBG_19FT_COMBO_42_9]|uniref:Elongation factor P n=1 Tax=Candidatus Woesebacteria bacterium RBG_16_42_24 TaxID=1802485 RepID=A0A1F7XLV0_9BACT|nr:MAG: elongation factor P [Candidatus Woesebacteria bacterium RBG_16_42_24]OGM16407.1 MAG: elongation factor P [Candidatus Woesebacteria bacterium RBG_19FT_COMBO_42_9]OGM67338.1 MAG: elongation factor P [Candidatus Woesebacteria bacterium RIFCSPLOWO2_01_FULL_43_11]
MIAATDLKNGATFLSNDEPYQVIKYSLIKMGRGGAVVKVTAKNLMSGSIEERSFSSNVTVDEVTTTKRQLQYLYKDAKSAVFMDPKSYEQVEIPLSILGDQILFVKEGGNATILFWSFGGAQDKEDKALSIEIPPKVTFVVRETDPGVKGNSATNIYKPATLENGLKLKVPLFIEKGDRITVDTRTGEYVERAK